MVINMENIEIITEKLIDEIFEYDVQKKIMILDSLQKVDNPFAMLTIKDVMKDLNISESAVY